MVPASTAAAEGRTGLRQTDSNSCERGPPLPTRTPRANVSTPHRRAATAGVGKESPAPARGDSEPRQVVAELKRTLEQKTAELRLLVEEKERESAQIDARALPVVGFGILLSGIPEELASISFGLGWIF